MRIPLAVLFLFSAAASPIPQSSSDQELQGEVRRALLAADFGAESITVTSRNAIVVLRGEVRDARAKILAVEAAFSVVAVQEIETALELRYSVTPELEEDIWFVLMQEGLDEGIDRILVENGIASIEASSPDQDRRARLTDILTRIPGVRSVTFESQPIVSDIPRVPPEPPAATETAVEEVTPPAPEAPTPSAATTEVPEAEVVEEPEPIKGTPKTSPPEPEPEPETMPTTPEPEPARAPTRAVPSVDLAPANAERIGKDIVKQILTYPEYTVFDHIQFGMEQGIVRLKGFVTEPSKKEELENRVASVSGILHIENEIQVLSEVSSDNALRKRLFDRIYQDPSFADFADSTNPPIHIIVEASGVILMGVVDRRIHAAVAEMIAQNTFGVRRVENRLRVASSSRSP